ncbi:ExbD/TolR family protein [Herbaspirillum camelliae]|uniref:ExbD/TolR family protein n=1 Tax=Herbaspirillum camelliae TaxID=1892903 RepID=UPI00094A07E2|nr:biopolymer transporter ExbD [Herbaspirillum camelliae]
MAITNQDDDDVLSEMNVTPLVDVMLVLLVVFIVAAPLMTNSIKVNLPRTGAIAASQEKAPTVISVNAQGQFYLNGALVDSAAIESSLSRQHQDNPDLRIRLEADQETQYRNVAKAMAAVERAGVTRLSVITAR